MKSPMHVARVTALAVLAGGLIGCGYTTQSMGRPGIKTIAVPVWQRGRNVYRRGLEFRLTEAIKKRIGLETDYVIANREHADSELVGSVDKISRQGLSRNPDSGMIQEEQITLHLSFAWTDLRTGKEIIPKKSFPVAETRVITSSAGQDFYQGSEATINKAARLIVEELEQPWGQDQAAVPKER